MKRFLAPALFTLLLIFVILAIYVDYGQNFFSVILKFGEIIIVFALFAGLLSTLFKEGAKVREKGVLKQWSSVVTLASFLFTFSAAVVSFNEDKYAFNNLIREEALYLVEVSDIVLGDDFYLSRFPARKKLSLYLSTQISSYFTPTDEMLKEAGMTNEDFKELKYKKGAFAESGSGVINRDDLKMVSELEKKVTDLAKESVSRMLPVASELNDWFHNSLKSFESSGDKEIKVPDFYFEKLEIKGTGLLLKKWLDEKSLNGVSSAEMAKLYVDFAGTSGIADMVAASCSENENGEVVSKEANKKMFAAFLKTGVSSSPKMKGYIRWLHRSVFDPLFSTFMAMLFFSMLFAAYRLLNFKNYSYFVVSISVCIGILGLLPHTSSFLSSFLSSGRHGPFSEGWLMNVFVSPALKALAIGIGTGVLFHVAETFFGTLKPDYGRKK
ncbi:MAG: hypothetical protein ACOX2F_07490 [bacterium]